jgi:DNA repair exonuclease SbcCD ATPase subunit
MKLIKLSAKNFGSHESIEIDFKSGLTLIDGWNHDLQSANGVGKSVFLNSIVFAIYGDSVKKLKLSEIIREGCTSMSTDVTLTTHLGEVRIVRSRGPNQIELYVNGVKFESTKVKIEDQILSSLDLTFNQFIQVCYRYQKADDRFLKLNDTQKKEFLTSVLNLDAYSAAYKATHQTLTDKEKELAKLNGLLLGTQNSLDQKTEEVKNIEAHEAKILVALVAAESEADQRSATIAENQRKRSEEEATKTANLKASSEQIISSTKVKLEVLAEELARLEKQKTEADPAAQIRALEAKRAPIKSRYDSAQKAQTLLGELDRQLPKLHIQLRDAEEKKPVPDSCSKCGQSLADFNPDHYFESLAKEVTAKRNEVILAEARHEKFRVVANLIPATEAELKALDILIQEARSSAGSLDMPIFKLKNEHQTVTSLMKREVENIQVADRNLQFTLANIEAEAARAKKDIAHDLIVRRVSLENIRDGLRRARCSLTTLSSEIAKIKSDISEAQQDILYLTEAKRIFSPVGVRAFIFDSLISSLNQRLDYYLQPLFNGLLRFEYVSDEQTGKFTEHMTYGKNRSLAMLSGGEECRLSLAVDLALSDVIAQRLAVQPNVLILDEALEGIDAVGAECVMSLLQDLEKTKDSIFVVHHGSEFKSSFAHVIQLELKNGVTSKV